MRIGIPRRLYLGGFKLVVLFIVLARVQVAYGQELPHPGQMIMKIISRHPSIRKAENLVLAAQASLAGSKLQPNPTLTLAATLGDAGESSNSLNQTFEVSGQPRLRYEKAAAELKEARFVLAETRRGIAALVCKDWLRLWSSYHQLLLARVRLHLVSEMVRVAQRRYEVGEIPRNESLRVELAEAEAQADFEKNRAEFQGAKRALLLLVGLYVDEGSQVDLEALEDLERSLLGSEAGINASIDIERVFERPKLMEDAPDWSLVEVVGAVDSHPQLAAKREQVQAALLQAKLTGKEGAPVLGFSLYRSRLAASVVEQGAQLYISWPIFDWGSLRAKQRAEEFEAKAQQAEMEELRLNLCRQVSELWTQWQAAKARRAILEVQAGRYEDLARKSKTGYDLGLLSLTDVLQTETAFRQAGVQLIEAQVQVSLLEIELLESTNLSWPKSLLEEL